VDEIRSFIVKYAPRNQQTRAALNVIDALYLILATEDYDFLPHALDPPTDVKTALAAIADESSVEAISVPVGKIGWLDYDWLPDTGKLLGRRLLDDLIANPRYAKRYAEWERAWGNQPYVNELTEIAMASNDTSGLNPQEARRLRYAIDQNLYFFLGYCLGSAVVGSTRLFDSLHSVCRHLPFGIPLGRCRTEAWNGWIIAGL
jgi:hypothetical protein